MRRYSPRWPRPGSYLDVGGPTTTMRDHTRGSEGRSPPSSPSPVTRAGIWRCAMPKAPRQLPSLPPPNRANPTARANSGLDRTWGQGHLRENYVKEKDLSSDPSGDQGSTYS